MTATPTLIAGRYRLGEPLGVGGMGKVWLARDETLDRDVAVKEILLPAELTAAGGDAVRARTLREARAAARLSHPGVVQVYDVLEADNRTWIVMEYVPSRSLQEVIKADGPLEPRRVARIGLELLAALGAAHRAGVWHRDVKPANVLLADDGRVVLTDFGIATIEGDSLVTGAGLVVGSPEFMSPERARHGIARPASDLWSLGATLYAAVEGRSPYKRGSAIETLTALVAEEPDPPQRAGVLRPVLDGLLRKDPAARTDLAETERRLRAAASGTKVPRQRRRWRAGRTYQPAADVVIPVEPPLREARATGRAAVPAAPIQPPPATEIEAADATEIQDPDATEIRDPDATEIRDPDATEIRDLDATEIRDPDATEIRDPDATEIRDPDATEIRDPDATEIRDPDATEIEPAKATSTASAGTRSTEVADAAGAEAVEATEADAVEAPRIRPADVAVAPARPATTGRGRRWALAVVAAVLALAGVAWLIAQPDRSGADRDSVAPTAATTGAATDAATGEATGAATGVPGVPGAGQGDSAGGSAPATSGASAPASGGPAPSRTGQQRPALPNGWREYRDSTGFSVYVPKGWNRSRKGSIVYFRDPETGRVLGIDQTTRPKSDPVADWRSQASYRVARGDFPNYDEIRIVSVRYFLKAADWEFTFDGERRRQHVNNRGFVVSKSLAYGIWWQTSDADWADAWPALQLVFASFRPATN